MEEEKLLPLLKNFFKNLLFLSLAIRLCTGVCMAGNDREWANDLGKNTTEMVWQDLKSRFEASGLINTHGCAEDGSEPAKKRFAGLYVFISTSMPKPLLKSYFAEANKYGAVLVLKGLPKGSFKELARFVQDLSNERDLNAEQYGSLQIDDEAFARFGVEAVPTIILAKESDYHPVQSSKISFDSITGNVGIKYSLKEFSKSGDLKEEAGEYLGVVKN